ncbi:glycosyltransferase [bacterium]|nr:glycosyltransferase [bacterium]
MLGSKFLRRNVVVFYRGWKESTAYFLKRNPLIRRVFRFVYGRADVTVVLASRFKEDLVEMGWPPSSIEITTTMYDAKEILPASHRSGERPRFLYLGRISHLKGMRELIEACKVLANRGIDFECVVVGHGDRKGVVEMYESLIKDYGIDNCFRFLGRLTGREKYQAYSTSDIYVFPSWTEGCPNSVLEALGSGLFVVSTDVGALRDIIRNGENGKIVRCKDPLDLADTLASVCENIENIRNKRQTIQKDAEAHFETGIIIKQFIKMYHGLTNG